MSAFSISLVSSLQSSDMGEHHRSAPQGRPEANPDLLPGNDFAVLDEFAGEIVRRVGRQPDDGGSAFGDRASRVFAAHIGTNPAGADAVDRALRQRSRQLNGHAV